LHPSRASIFDWQICCKSGITDWIRRPEEKGLDDHISVFSKLINPPNYATLHCHKIYYNSEALRRRLLTFFAGKMGFGREENKSAFLKITDLEIK